MEERTVVKHGAFVRIPHELLLDSGLHECDDTCPAPWMPPVLTPKQRALRQARRLWWAVRQIPSLRIVHKDDICDGDCS
jgi:hypothetical protein